MTISTQVATHILVFKDKSKKYINESAFKHIWNEINKGSSIITMGSQAINLKEIKVMESLEEYYKQYPSERPVVNQPKEFTGQGFDRIIRSAPERALDNMIQGLTKMIERDKIPAGNPSQELLTRMLKRKREYEDKKNQEAIGTQDKGTPKEEVRSLSKGDSQGQSPVEMPIRRMF